MDLAVSFLLFCDAAEDEVWCHSIGEGLKSGLLVHRGKCDGDIDSSLSSVVKALIQSADDAEEEEKTVKGLMN